jgi:uncharacterized membrane protein (UPF0127 family)
MPVVTRIETESGRPVATRVVRANRFCERLLGLLRRRQLDSDEGLLLMPGGSIHTLGMHFPIDVIFLDAQMRIRKIARGVRPWRMSFSTRDTHCVLELASGRATTVSLHIGMRLVELAKECA